MRSSEFLRAQNISGSVALVPTTSVFSNKDLVIPPEPEMSTIIGASNILMQSQQACGLGYNVDHLSGSYILLPSLSNILTTVNSYSSI